MLGPIRGSGYRRPPSLVRRADGQTLQLTPILYEVLAAIDGRRGYEELASVVSDRISKQADPQAIRYLVERKLRPLGVLRRADGSEPSVERMNPLLALRLRKVISNPKVTRRITAPFSGLFRAWIAVPVLIAFFAASVWVLFEQGLAPATRAALYDPAMLLLIFLLTTVSAGFHEFGHAAAARYEGATPGAMGVGLYLVWPVFYTDVTDAYRLPRRGRLRVDVGGLYFNAVFTVLTVGAWAITGWEALLLLVPIQLLHMLHQLLPVVRFDGYHILADLTGVPDLFAHIKPSLLGLLPGRRVRGEPAVLRPWVRFVVSLWVLLVIPLLATAFALMVTVLPRVAATAWDSMGARWDMLVGHVSRAEAIEATVVLISIAAMLVPVLSLAYLALRVVRRTGVRVWRATDQRPARRGAALVAAAAAAALLAWAWWPNGQYEPIGPDERGALLAPHGATVAAPGWTETASGQPIASGSLRPRLALILSPQGESAAEPATRHVLLPPTDPGESGGWPFPFDPPAPPAEGDNQALAVATEDGTSVYDVAIALVWVSQEPVDNTNEAWAVASCSDCSAFAFAFQGVFMPEGQEVVTPQNLAAAVNYECERCETLAVAAQLVVTLTEPPSDEAMARLDDLMGGLEELGRSLGHLSLEEILAEVERFEVAILQILADDGVIASTGAPTGEISEAAAELTAGSPDEETAGTAPEDESPSPGPSPSASPEPSPSEDPEPTAEPSPSEDPEPTAEPSPTAEPAPAG